jgi:proline racemase
MAVLHAREELSIGQEFVHESIIGTTFTGRLVAQTTMKDGRNAVVPSITGRAWVTQYCTVVCEPSDPFPEGYTVGDLWA